MHPELGKSIGKVIFRKRRNGQQPRTQKNKWTPDEPQRIPNTFTLFVRGHRAQKIETHKLSPTAPERDIRKRCIKFTAMSSSNQGDKGEAANTQKSWELKDNELWYLTFSPSKVKSVKWMIHSLLLVLATYLPSMIGTITKYPSKV
jgi:hypothetical protein